MNELNEFLKQNPHLKSFQERLEKEMDEVPEQFRLLVLSKYILNNIDELNTEMLLLEQTINKIQLLGKSE